ncbi:MAG TPA: hypothetical protein VGN52_05590 [Burkholderiales bacterium]
MGLVEPAGFPGYAGNWADGHVESGLNFDRLQQAFGEAEDPETTDDEWFEDDLLSLIQNRPSRHARHPHTA